LNFCAIAIGNRSILIRCAAHHPADPVKHFARFRRYFSKKMLINNELFQNRSLIGGLMSPPYGLSRIRATN